MEPASWWVPAGDGGFHCPRGVLFEPGRQGTHQLLGQHVLAQLRQALQGVGRVQQALHLLHRQRPRRVGLRQGGRSAWAAAQEQATRIQRLQLLYQLRALRKSLLRHGPRCEEAAENLSADAQLACSTTDILLPASTAAGKGHRWCYLAQE